MVSYTTKNLPMRKASVVYKGQSDKIGRFGNVETGAELLLHESEYRCVAEDPRYEFLNWVEVSRKGEVTIVADEVEEDLLEQEGGDEADEADEESLDDCTVAELKEIIATINQYLEEGEQISTTGKKADLIDRIEAYQAAQAALES